MNAKPTSLPSNMMMRVRLSLYAPNPQTNAHYDWHLSSPTIV